jgi:glutamine amidotransferase
MTKTTPLSEQLVIVVDYGMGNLGSILNMLKKVGVPARLSSGPGDVLKADKIILPGVGAFDNAMKKLRGIGYVDALNQRVLVDKVPILGICLGMQILGRRSEEGQEPGLGWLDAQTVRFQFNDARQEPKVPHMGWNTIRICRESNLFPNPEMERRFYFVHSFHVQCNNTGDVLTRTQYGLEFTSAVFHDNILGTQFHPEKSHRFGLEFFRAFAAWFPGKAPGR